MDWLMDVIDFQVHVQLCAVFTESSTLNTLYVHQYNSPG